MRSKEEIMNLLATTEERINETKSSSTEILIYTMLSSTLKWVLNEGVLDIDKIRQKNDIKIEPL